MSFDRIAAWKGGTVVTSIGSSIYGRYNTALRSTYLTHNRT